MVGKVVAAQSGHGWARDGWTEAHTAARVGRASQMLARHALAAKGVKLAFERAKWDARMEDGWLEQSLTMEQRKPLDNRRQDYDWRSIGASYSQGKDKQGLTQNALGDLWFQHPGASRDQPQVNSPEGQRSSLSVGWCSLVGTCGTPCGKTKTTILLNGPW